MPFSPDSPVGVFDSGHGGLSVLRHIRALLPHEDLLYFADSGFAPYGGRPEHEITERTLASADFLMQRGAKALVVACNTATAAAIRVLRERYPELPLVGVEPGLKPAAGLTKTGIVGVLATARTLSSAKFATLRDEITAATNVHFLAQPCVGLADQVDKGELQSPATIQMVKRYVQPLIEQGADTLVLGCTHYPFVQPLIENAAAAAGAQAITIVDTGDAVSKQLARLLVQHELVHSAEHVGTLHGFTTGRASSLTTAFDRLLHLQPTVMQVVAQTAAEATAK